MSRRPKYTQSQSGQVFQVSRLQERVARLEYLFEREDQVLEVMANAIQKLAEIIGPHAVEALFPKPPEPEAPQAEASDPSPLGDPAPEEPAASVGTGDERAA